MKANQKLLDRDASSAFATTLASQLAVAESIVDYGTNLIVRVMTYGADGSIEHLVPVCTLAKQSVTMLDGIAVLLGSGCGIAIYPICRSIFEADLQMTWMLTTDKEARARTYWIAHLLTEKRRCESELPDSPSRKQVSQQFAQMEWRGETDTNAEIAEIDSILTRPENATICAEVLAAKPKFWATRLGCNNFESMARQVGRWAEYEVLYRLLSALTHSSSPKAHLRKSKKSGSRVEIRNIRDPASAERILTMSSYWTLRCYRTVLEHYRPDELQGFATKYEREWRSVMKSCVV